MKEVVILHGVPKRIILNRDVKFTSNFSKEIFVGLGIDLAFSTKYHPQTGGKTKRTNRIIQDMLKIYVMYQPSGKNTFQWWFFPKTMGIRNH